MKYSAYNILRLLLATVFLMLAAAVVFHVLPFWIGAVVFTTVTGIAFIGRPFVAFSLSFAVALLALSEPTLAADTITAFPSPSEVGPPLIAAPSWVPAFLYPVWNYIGSGAVILWLLTHARAFIPTTGPWAIVGSIWDLIAGNYKLAANASTSS